MQASPARCPSVTKRVAAWRPRHNRPNAIRPIGAGNVAACAQAYDMREARLDASAPGRHSPRSTLAGTKRVPRGFDGVQLIYDLAIIGGGVNGCGIARDAAGRGLSVVLCEQGDLAGATSSASTKLDSWRSPLPRALRLPPRPRGTRRARGAPPLRAPHHPPAALRPAPSRWASGRGRSSASASSSTIISAGASIAARNPQPRPVDR